ncbi:ribonuclease Z [Guptibacillus algicola]|uniref:ribonuclease Z n=1 Tax=Guptibacillus algicola TaxID=225844 RepID=UPI001CD214D1|nr:ribonuclease Z [Alkalihalobacillus algicola]MCA0985937.1 ribonuclease Z [Alkalihalobacillus algicola]
MDLTFLGTGGGVPSTKRNVSSIALRIESGETWLFDCGEATQHQILSSTITLSKITKIFITHLHGDHIFGLPGLLGSRSFQSGESDLTIYGPVGIKEFIDSSLKVSGTYLRYSLHIVEINQEMGMQLGDYEVETALLEHGITSFGYRIIEANKPGRLDVDKLKRFGVKPGPLYKKLKAGGEIEHNGRIITADEVTGPVIPGRCLVICGDTRYSKKTITLAQGADLLVHEATFSKDKETLAYDYFHSTTVEAASIAREADVKKLVLTHISSRYQEEDLDRMLDEAKEIFSNTQIVKDHDSIHIPQHSSPKI